MAPLRSTRACFRYATQKNTAEAVKDVAYLIAGVCADDLSFCSPGHAALRFPRGRYRVQAAFLTGICRAWAFGDFGTITSSTPSLVVAEILSGSAPCGSVKERKNFP